MWKENRNLVQQDMSHPKSALFYIAELSDLVDDVIAKLLSSQNQQGEVTNLNMTMKEYGLEAIATMFLSKKVGILAGSAEGRELTDKVVRFVNIYLATLMIPPALRKISPQYKEFVEIQRFMYTFCQQHIRPALQAVRDGQLKGTIIAKLVDRCGKDSNVPIVVAVDSMGAGMDTTGNTSAFLIYDLATNPDKQELLYREICEVVGKTGQMTEKKLVKMRYLKACVNESLRLNPIISATTRTTQVDMVLGGYQIPKGTFLNLHNAVHTNNEKYFSEPETFKPERWIRGNHIRTRSPIEAMEVLPPPLPLYEIMTEHPTN